MKLQPSLNFDDPERPRTVVTETAAEYFRWIEREKAGECFIETMEVVPRFNSHWKLRLRWNQ